MVDKPSDEDETDEAPPRSPTEGVRIHGAISASDAVGDTDSESDEADTPRLNFPEASSPGEFGSVPVIRAGDGPPIEIAELPPVEPDQEFELPHYTEPPTGQVPKVVIGEETDERWSGLADQPRWRDTESQFDEQAGFEDLVDDGPRLGALADTGEHRDFFADLDLTDERTPTVSASKSDPGDDEGPDATPRRPPAPRRRRAATERPARQPRPAVAMGADSGGGGRNLPMAVSVGLALLAIGGGCFFIGATATMLLITVVLCICAIEFFTTLTQSGYRPAGLLGVVAVGGLAITPLYEGFFAYPIVLGLTTLAGLAWFLFVQPGEGAVMNLGVTLLGVGYIGGLGSFATLTLGVARSAQQAKLTNQGIGVLVAAVLVTVSYDVGAYFIGRAFGHTPLNAASPNKTQEGLFGGMFAGIVIPFLILWLSKWAPVGVGAQKTLAFCLICALMAPVGDLCESAIKRDLGVKDMGSLLPGHGGALDRFDAMLFVLPTAYFMAHLLNLGKPAFF